MGEEPYDLICLDILMPQMDGREALRIIREIEKARGIDRGDGAKVIMTSALSDAKNVLDSFEEGCEVYIPKPYPKDTLIDEIRKLGLID